MNAFGFDDDVFAMLKREQEELGSFGNELLGLNHGSSGPHNTLANPEYARMSRVLPYDSMRMPFRVKHSVRLPSGLPPRHIMRAYEKANEGRVKCEECGRTEDDDGMIVHEGWCSQYGPCPRCGSTNKTSEGFGGYFSHCNDCGYDVSLF